MAVNHMNKSNITKKKGTFRNKNRSYRTRKTLKKRKSKKTGGDKSPTKKAYKSTNETKPNKRLIREQKIMILKDKLPDKPEKSLARAFVKFSLEDVENMNINQLTQVYNNWRLKEATERSNLRLKDTIKKMPIYKTIPRDEYSDIHYHGEPFNMYNPPNTINKSLEETQDWLNEVPIKSRKSPKSRKQNNWISHNIQSHNRGYDINNPPSQMKRDIEQFSNEFDEYNIPEADENFDLLDFDVKSV